MNIAMIIMRDGKTDSGVGTANSRIASKLRKKGHAVTLITSGGSFGFERLDQLTKQTGCPVIEARGLYSNPADIEIVEVPRLSRLLQPFDWIIVSGIHFAYSRIIKAALGKPVDIFTHGQQVSPLATNDLTEFKRGNVRLICINEIHRQEARFKGIEDRAACGPKTLMFDLPIPFLPREVKPAGSYCVAVGTAIRKNLERVAETAAALNPGSPTSPQARWGGMECRVYGAPNKNTQSFIDASPWLKYMGEVPHDELLEVIAGAAFMIHMGIIEGRPMCVLEALGLGVPVIVLDTILYDFVKEAPWCVMLDPSRPVAEQIDNDFDRRFLALDNRKVLAKWAHEQYGDAHLEKQLMELLKNNRFEV